MINFTKKLSILAFCLLFFLVFIPETNIKASEITTATLAGTGTQEDPYIVSTPEEVDRIRYDLDAYYEVVCDIDMAGYDFVMIGTKKNPFVGVINGNGHTIYNLSDAFVRFNTTYIIYNINVIETDD